MAMANLYDLEITVCSAKDLKNVNWRNGPLKPYAVVWIDPSIGSAVKCSTKVDQDGDTNPTWNHTLRMPLHTPPDEDSTLCIDVVHFGEEDKDTKPLIGSAKLRLSDVLEVAGFGERIERTLQLKRPSGRPQGKIDVKLQLNRLQLSPPPPPPYGYGYGVAPPPPPPTPYGNYPYAAAPAPYYSTPPQSRDDYSYSAPPPPPPPYGNYPYAAQQVASPYYSAPPAGYPYDGQPVIVEEEQKKKSKFGMGTGLAVGAVAGVLGGLALAEGVDYVEDKIADDIADKVEDDLSDDGDAF